MLGYVVVISLLTVQYLFLAMSENVHPIAQETLPEEKCTYLFGLQERASCPYPFGLKEREGSPYPFGLKEREGSPYPFGLNEEETCHYCFGIREKEEEVPICVVEKPQPSVIVLPKENNVPLPAPVPAPVLSFPKPTFSDWCSNYLVPKRLDLRYTDGTDRNDAIRTVTQPERPSSHPTTAWGNSCPL